MISGGLVAFAAGICLAPTSRPTHRHPFCGRTSARKHRTIKAVDDLEESGALPLLIENEPAQLREAQFANKLQEASRQLKQSLKRMPTAADLQDYLLMEDNLVMSIPELEQRAADAFRARDAVVQKCQPMVQRLASRYDASQGVILCYPVLSYVIPRHLARAALDKYDASRGVDFGAFAIWHVRGCILRAVRQQGGMVRLPANLQSEMRQLEQARSSLEQSNEGRAASAGQLAEAMHLSEDRVQQLQTYLDQRYTQSLDISLKGQSEAGRGTAFVELASLQQSQAGAEGLPAEQELFLEQVRGTLVAMQQTRGPRNGRILRLHYGLEDGKEWTMAELASEYSLSKSRIQQIIAQELGFLRTAMAEQLGDDLLSNMG